MLHLGMVSKNELKFIRSLKNKKYRLSEKRFLVEGEKNVLELLASDFEVVKVLGTESFLSQHKGSLSGHHFDEIKTSTLSEISNLKSNNAAIAIAVMRNYSLNDLDLNAHLFALDGVNDPGNLGTIIRTLDWFGFDQLACSPDTVELYNPKVISACKGSFTRIKVVYTSLEKLLDKYSGPKIGADLTGTSLHDWRPTGATLMVMGSESHGIKAELKGKLDAMVSIKKAGHAESLNVGVATGIICAHLAK